MTSSRAVRGMTLMGMFALGIQSANAQSCLGLADLSRARNTLSTTGTGTGPDRLVLGRLGLGGTRAFGGLSAGYGGRGFDNPQSLAAGGDVGYALELGSSQTTLCPVAQGYYHGHERINGIREQGFNSAIGLALGHSLNVTPSFSLIPYVQGNLQNRYYNYAGTLTFYSEAARRISDAGKVWGGEYGAGLGLRFGNAFTIRPSFMLRRGFPPGSALNSEPTYSLSASFGIGKRR